LTTKKPISDVQKPVAMCAKENHEENEQGDLDATEPGPPEQVGHEHTWQPREHEDAREEKDTAARDSPLVKTVRGETFMGSCI